MGKSKMVTVGSVADQDICRRGEPMAGGRNFGPCAVAICFFTSFNKGRLAGPVGPPDPLKYFNIIQFEVTFFASFTKYSELPRNVHRPNL